MTCTCACTSECDSKPTKRGNAWLSLMINRLAISRDTFCRAPAAEPQTDECSERSNLTSDLIPPFRRMTRMAYTSELILCNAPTARALTCRVGRKRENGVHNLRRRALGAFHKHEIYERTHIDRRNVQKLHQRRDRPQIPHDHPTFWLEANALQRASGIGLKFFIVRRQKTHLHEIGCSIICH